jgi:hypothetical protein
MIVAEEAEVEVEVKVVKEKKKRLIKRAAMRRKKRELQEAHKEGEEDVEIPDTDTVTVPRSEWEKMKKMMKDAVDRLAECERASSGYDVGTPAKRVCAPTIRVRYFEKPSLVNPVHFHNWWAHSLSKPIP